MKELPTSHKVEKGPDSHKGSKVLAKPGRVDSAASEKSALEHVRSLSKKLADVQILADARLQEIIILSKLVVELREQANSKAISPSTTNKNQKTRFWNVASYFSRRSQHNIKKDLMVLRNNPLFDSAWYLKNYPDVKKSGLDPALHYLKFGAKEGRDPGPKFSTLGYIKKHSELDVSEENPLLNYIRKSS